MSKLFVWLGVATLAVICSARVSFAGPNDPLKPYVVLILDTSGSMVWTGSGNPTGAGPTSCGTPDTKLNHAKCAIQNIANSYGDMVFALGRFRTTMGGTTTTGTFPAGCCEAGPAIGGSNGCAAGPTGGGAANSCNTADSYLQLLTGLVDGANSSTAVFVNGTGNSCTTGGTDPEIWDAENACTGAGGAGGTCGGGTPLEGVLNGAKRYWSGLQASDGTPIWPAASGGFDPIRADPTKNVFLPPNGQTTCNPNPTTCSNAANCGTTNNCCCISQCRPYITILLTDGDESCNGNPPVAATALQSTDIDGKRYRVITKPIGFGVGSPTATIENIAHAGGTPDVAGVNEGYYASNEAELELAISSILAGAVKTEVCNGRDDDCDTVIDEGFSLGGACNNNRLGACRVLGTDTCRADGAGTTCSAGVASCSGKALNAACTVTNASNTSVAGTCKDNGGVLVCDPTAFGTPGDPNNEVPLGCNGIDDDCDGKIDENVPGCVCNPVPEQCNKLDDDCDGQIDENLTIPCGTGVCQGVQTCNPATGMYGACSAQPPTTEICDGLDNDCDGNKDGFTQVCSNMTCPGGTCTASTCVGGSRAGLACNTFPAFDPKNNPGGAHSPMTGCEMEGPAICICHPGNRTCPINGNGMFTACLGEQEPQLEICNGLDDDCDGKVDETPAITCTTNAQCANSPLTPACDNPSGMPNAGTCGPADCSTNCGVGNLVCVNGMQQCNSVPAQNDATCNGIDDDCDGMIDEDWKCANPLGPDGVAGTPDDCPCTTSGQCNAHEACNNGGVTCTGTPVAQESCNCLDDNCNGQVDEGSLCPPGATCTNCQCAFQCSPGEFPCPLGKKCMNNFCIADPCFGVSCPDVNGNKQVCTTPAATPNQATCVDACTTVSCPGSQICIGSTGMCKPNDCTTFPAMCAANQNCIVNSEGNGVCVGNPCDGVTCGADQYCEAGQCYGSCAGVECPTGKRCRLGVCETDPCGHPCPFGKACNPDTGQCINDPCEFVTCLQGQYCNPDHGGMCEPDPCIGTKCPHAGEVCKGGTCYDPQDFLPDAGMEQHVTTGGGGGCSTTGGGSLGAGLLVGLAVLVTRRRRRGASIGGAL